MDLKKISSLHYIFLTFAICITAIFSNAHAAKKRTLRYVPKYAALVVDANTQKVLFHHNANSRVNPASLTKMMTIYLAFEKVKKGQISMNYRLPISRHAAAQPKTNINLRRGSTITLKEAILSLIVKSANDSSVVIAEAIGGTEKNFVKLMNKRAKQLGMTKTNFTNPSGWHHRKQKTTALDMAKLAIALKRDHQKYYHLFSRTSFYYKNKLLKSHNHVLNKLKGAEGMKTGYTSNAGWNLVTTALQGRTRLVGVIIGGKSGRSRDHKMVAMLNNHFKKINHIKKTRKVYASNKRRAHISPTHKQRKAA